MGIFDKITKPQDDTEKFMHEVEEFLIQGEEVENIYRQVIDYLCITNKRVIFVDKDLSIKDPTVTIHSVPFKNIVSIGFEKNSKPAAMTDVLSITTINTVYQIKFTRAITDSKVVYNQLAGKII